MRPLLKAASLLCWLAIASAVKAGPPVFPVPVDTSGLVSASAGARQGAGMVPVCNNAAFGTSSSAGGSALQYQFRTVLYCPDGVQSLRLVFSGAWVAGNVETDLTAAVPYLLSWEIAPAPWSASKSYSVGDQVAWNPTFATGQGGSVFTANNANTNSMPTPSNADWTMATVATVSRITCNGQAACNIGTITNAAGTTLPQGFFITDPISPGAACQKACYVAIRGWAATSGTVTYNVPQPFSSGNYNNSAATIADYTMSTTGLGNVGSVNNLTIRPALAIGVPAKNQGANTYCVIGDSIASSARGYGLAGSYTLSSGGSGFVSSDIGKQLVMSRTGATAGAVAEDARFQIMNVSGGAVTALRMIDTGSYTNTGSNTSQTLPTSSQTLSGSTTGSGVTLSGVSFSTTTFDTGDQYYAQGFIQRGLSAAGKRYALFVSPGDDATHWVTRDYTRMALVALSGCTIGINQLAVNDITGGRTLAQIQAAETMLAYQLLGYGVKAVYATTATPYSTSTDGYITLSGQTVSGNDSIRQSLNTWRRSIPAPYAGIIDVAAAIEDGGATSPTGKFKVDGVTVGLYDIDAKHLTVSGHTLAAAPVATWAATH